MDKCQDKSPQSGFCNEAFVDETEETECRKGSSAREVLENKIIVTVLDECKEKQEGLGSKDSEKSSKECTAALEKVCADQNDSQRKGLSGTNLFVYCSHFLSAWGDRMWSFGVGLFLININPESLQLTAVYGLCMSLSVLLFGALIGDIVDDTPRLKAAQVALVLQNSFVVTCAVVVYIFLVYRGDILSLWDGSHYLAYTLIILLSVLSRLTSIARTLAVEKDWIIEICGREPNKLATMTASLRRIDLATQVLAPIATGAIMSYTGVEFGALFIGGWNLVSVFVEYGFLWKVYNTVPALKRKKNLKKSEEATAHEFDVENDEDQENALTTPKQNDEEMGAEEKGEKDDDTHEKSGEVVTENSEADVIITSKAKGQEKDSVTKEEQGCRCPRIFSSFERLYRGWPIYAGYDVVHAGLGLACLYMTVLGLDNITVGYAKMQGVSEGLIGVMMGFAASFGILGTFMYPLMRKKLGLPRTGIFGLSFEVLSLVSCVVSVWMPGSQFDLSIGLRAPPEEEKQNCTTDSLVMLNSSLQNQFSTVILPSLNTTFFCEEGKNEALVSVWMLMIGIVTARFGLWVADLSITQLFLESVKEEERGKVNGVQSSLNQFMDMLKFIMVVLLPYEHTFGLLIIVSFSFVCLGWLSYAYFLKKSRGHFFHFDKCLVGCGAKPSVPNGNV